MEKPDSFASILYATTLRIIQPARVQDIYQAVTKVWGEDATSLSKEALYNCHKFFRREGLIFAVRKGSYRLTNEGLSIADAVIKPRRLDNLRLFLMKRQRRMYYSAARRYE